MRTYLNMSMEALAAELTAGLKRLRRGYADAAEALLEIIKPDRDYPFEFIVYRLTGYRPPAGDAEPVSHESLRHDLLHLILDICDSTDLSTEDYDEPVYDTAALASRFHVATKTIQRWRRDGLVARRLIFPDGRRRIAFLESSVRRYTRGKKGRVARSSRFSQMSQAQRQDILRRARRMASFCSCSLSEVVRRVARRTGRAMETVRYTIRNYDTRHPNKAIFPKLTSRLEDQDKASVYRGFLRGVPVADLASQYGRTRGSIYRIINEMRARRLLDRPIRYVHNPQFDLPNADEQILPSADARDEAPAETGRNDVPKNLPPYLRALYEVPLLTPTGERDLFRLYNYLKYKADMQRRRLDLNRLRTTDLREIEQLLLQANVTKNKIIRANLRLVVSIAKKHVGGAQSLFELISDGNVSLMMAVEKFDYARGNRFSTYASWAIIRNFARSVPKERYHLDRFATGHDGILEVAAGLQTYDPNDLNPAELRESIDAVLAQLKPRERAILIEHYGLDEKHPPVTFDKLGKSMGISKERVRQIEIQALKKLREILQPRKADLIW